MKKTILFALLYCLSLQFLLAGELSAGLKFQAHDVVKEKRTSLLLNEGHELNMPDGFVLDFDVRFTPELHNYGYIFRIIANDSVSFDLVSNFTPDRRSLSFIGSSDIFAPFDAEALARHDINDWAHVRFGIDVAKSEISISFNDETMTLPCRNCGATDYRFQFGQCSHPEFESYDVPPMSIKNIRIATPAGKELAFWPLQKHAATEAYDAAGGLVASAHNPEWMADGHTRWKKACSIAAGHHAQLAYDSARGCIYLADRSNVFRISPARNTVDTIHVAAGNPYYISSNQLIYNTELDQLWTYDINRPVYHFDFETRSWSGDDKTLYNPEHAQHNAVIADSCLLLFGGYGEYTYRNAIHRYNPRTGRWDTPEVKGSIPPRYLAAAGFCGEDSLLIYGGFGHPSGMQELGPNSYSDLYLLNTRSGEIARLWENNRNADQRRVAGNALVTDKENNAFYTLSFQFNHNNSNICLDKIDISTGATETLADTIPFSFSDISSFCTLYLDRRASKLYAVTLTESGDTSTADVYTLDYPPYAADSVVIPEHKHKSGAWPVVAAIVVIAAAAAVVALRRKKSVATPGAAVPAVSNTTEETTDADIPRKSAVLFLNGFQVWDMNGNDITKSFTPTLKRLLVLIVMHSAKNGKGISNDAICDTLWPDKNREAAQNNRRVSIYKLKTLMEQTGAIELANDNAYWTIRFGEGSFCDYSAVASAMNDFRTTAEIDTKELYATLNLVASGKLLPAINLPWLDTFKADYATCVQDTLMGIVEAGNITDHKMLVRIADILFLFDSTDESALGIKCRALVKAGNAGMAKKVFDTFCAEYAELLGVPYEKTFRDIVAD